MGLEMFEKEILPISEKITKLRERVKAKKKDLVCVGVSAPFIRQLES